MDDAQLKAAIDTGLEWWCHARYAFAANPAKHYLGMAVGDRIRCLPRESGWWPADNAGAHGYVPTTYVAQKQ